MIQLYRIAETPWITQMWQYFYVDSTVNAILPPLVIESICSILLSIILQCCASHFHLSPLFFFSAFQAFFLERD